MPNATAVDIFAENTKDERYPKYRIDYMGFKNMPDTANSNNSIVDMEWAIDAYSSTNMVVKWDQDDPSDASNCLFDSTIVRTHLSDFHDFTELLAYEKTNLALLAKFWDIELQFDINNGSSIEIISDVLVPSDTFQIKDISGYGLSRFLRNGNLKVERPSRTELRIIRNYKFNKYEIMYLGSSKQHMCTEGSLEVSNITSEILCCDSYSTIEKIKIYGRYMLRDAEGKVCKDENSHFINRILSSHTKKAYGIFAKSEMKLGINATITLSIVPKAKVEEWILITKSGYAIRIVIKFPNILHVFPSSFKFKDDWISVEFYPSLSHTFPTIFTSEGNFLATSMSDLVLQPDLNNGSSLV
ncbi:hypothetical protein SNEBB_006862 [Seison nebaliae]|nr:hypothetical protein SNEBB_006862 [Seison nebaliae]